MALRRAVFPACACCQAILPPMRRHGRTRVWCSTSCRRWSSRHPGHRRAVDRRPRDLAALRLWAGDGWAVSEQPWSWPVSWATTLRAREVLADLDAATTAAP